MLQNSEASSEKSDGFGDYREVASGAVARRQPPDPAPVGTAMAETSGPAAGELVLLDPVESGLRRGLITIGQGATPGFARWTIEDFLQAGVRHVRCLSGRKPGKSLHILAGEALERFNEFWDEFGLKSGKTGAAWSWFQLEKSEGARFARETFPQIVHAARIEAGRRVAIDRAGGTPKWAQGWLTERRWEDGIYEEAGHYSPRQQALVDVYNKHCETHAGYVPVNGWTARRALQLDAALAARELKMWEKYFALLQLAEEHITERKIRRELFLLVHPEISETLVELIRTRISASRAAKSGGAQ